MEVNGNRATEAECGERKDRANPTTNAALTSQSPSTSVVLIDPYHFTQECLAQAFMQLNSGCSVHSYLSAAQCISRSTIRYDLILYHFHDSDGSPELMLNDLRDLRGFYPKASIIVLSDGTDSARPQIIRAMFNHGVDGFIPTRLVSVPVAFAAIHFVQAGGKFAPAELLLNACAEMTRLPSPHGIFCADLTTRQNAVVALLKQGKANKTIAHELGVSENTVKVHVRNIMRRIGATNRTEAVYKIGSISDLDTVDQADYVPVCESVTERQVQQHNRKERCDHQSSTDPSRANID